MKFKFIDLFSGIGGFRLALESLGGECVLSSDIDKWANETYFENFGEYPSGDITKISTLEIPDHDILCGGFPCQPFSIAGKRLGFADTRGTLFFEIERILKDKKPRGFILENVRGLVNHDKGNTLKIILAKLNELGYKVFYQVLNSADYGVPQNRERIYLVGFLNNVKDFTFPLPIEQKANLFEILEENVRDHYVSDIAKKHIKTHYDKLLQKKKILDKNPLIATEIRPSRCVFRNDGLSPCLTAKMGTGGNNVPVLVKEGRKLTVRECLRIQGFPETYKMKENNSHSYKQIGNSVSVPVIRAVAKQVIDTLNRPRFDDYCEISITPTRTSSNVEGHNTSLSQFV
jgi:DNA (cytosine-5)-methyltransferase 1